MAFRKVYWAIERGDWKNVSDMLDNGELSIEDINKQHDMVRLSCPDAAKISTLVRVFVYMSVYV